MRDATLMYQTFKKSPIDFMQVMRSDVQTATNELRWTDYIMEILRKIDANAETCICYGKLKGTDIEARIMNIRSKIFDMLPETQKSN